jgi:glutaconate CoA-transferase subunit B
MGILEPDETGELALTALYPGVSFDQVQENIGWSLKKAPRLADVALPTAKEFDLLRNKLDPKRLHIK